MKVGLHGLYVMKVNSVTWPGHNCQEQLSLSVLITLYMYVQYIYDR